MNDYGTFLVLMSFLAVSQVTFFACSKKVTKPKEDLSNSKSPKREKNESLQKDEILFKSLKIISFIFSMVLYVFIFIVVDSLDYRNTNFGYEGSPIAGKTYYQYKTVRLVDANFCLLDNGEYIQRFKLRADKKIPNSDFIIYKKSGYFEASNKDEFYLNREKRNPQLMAPWNIKDITEYVTLFPKYWFE